MSCHAIRNWTFSELVGAFLDLAIASLLLCASTLAYFASAFLSLFGLNLPCSCNGLFGNSNGQNCLQSQLLRLPAQKISFVQCSVKNKLPFHSSWNCNLQEERNEKHEAGDEAASCLSSSEDLAKMKEKGFVIGAINLSDFKERKFPRHRSRSHNNLRRRRGGTVNDNRKLPWVSNRSLCSDESPPPSLTRLAEDKADSLKNDANFRDGKEGLLDIGSKRKISHGFDLSESVDENEPIDDENGIDNNAKNTIRLLEQALEEEHAARSVLYVELEKERNAAATAADEAMAMILRLQEEKASIEMESRQRQRIVEDRYAYDEEEMNILKEILVRREKEKYFLEKEVEAYRQLMSNEQFLEGDTPGVAALAKGEYTLYLSDDESVVLMPQQNMIEDDNRSTFIEDNEPQRNSSAVITEIVELHESDENDQSKGIIHDVHVIDDKCIVSMEEQKTNKNKMIPVPIPTNSPASSNCTAKTGNTTPVIVSAGLPPTGKSKSWRSEMRRKSMSSFDAERFRIDNEIGWLREKLKFVHEGREKLNMNRNMREREKINQGQILEDITSHLREIRHLTEPGKAARRASLPPLSSNVMSKKRRWRSGTLTVQASI